MIIEFSTIRSFQIYFEVLPRSVRHSLLGCPCVCRKHTLIPRSFAPLQLGSSRSTPTHVRLYPSLAWTGCALTENLCRQSLSVLKESSQISQVFISK